MDWNSKWAWENFVEFGSKATESRKNGGSFNPSYSGVSAKNSLSASTDSSVEEGKQTPNSTLLKIQDFSGNCNKKKQIKRTEVSKAFPHLKTSMGSAEPLIGLKLGKRTYFENKGIEGNAKQTSTTALKKTKPSGQSINMPRCVVEGCEIDLSMAKVYHQKHRVCDIHSKCLKVIVGGLECRFCQQCSRFHNLSEFDEEKRSCRRRFSDHNARRRKPQSERTIQFNSARHSSLPFYGERQDLSFRLNESPLIHSRNYVDTTWDSTRSSKFTLTTGHPQKCTEEGGISNMLDNMQPLVPDVLTPGSKRSPICSDLEYRRRALSLLSNNKWGPPLPAHHALHGNGTMHTIPEAASPELCSNFQETHLIPLVNPYELAELYSQILK